MLRLALQPKCSAVQSVVIHEVLLLSNILIGSGVKARVPRKRPTVYE